MKKILLVVVAVLVAVALAAFEPWRAFTSSTIDEALPAVSVAPDPTATTDPGPRTLTRGTFVDAEHDTSGTARILELADGSRVLRLEGLASSDGPDLHVWLSDATSGGSWGKYDDGAYVRLGELKATHGNQNYSIPAEADLSAMRSVVIWCDRFNVAFGTAPIRVP